MEEEIEEEIEVYSEKTTDKDWYTSVRKVQIILCLIVTFLLFISYRTDVGGLKEGYAYLTEKSWTGEDFSRAVQSVKSVIAKIDNGQF